MEILKKKAEDLLEKARKYFAGTDKIESTQKTKQKKWINLILLIAFGFIMFLLILVFLSSGDKAGEISTIDNAIANYDSEHNQSDQDIIHHKIEFGSDVTKAEVKWQNFLEESIEKEGETREKQIAILKETINQHKAKSAAQSENEFQELRDRFSYLTNEIAALKAKNANLENDIASISAEPETIMPAELGVTVIDNKVKIAPPLSLYNHIPASDYVGGYLFGGLVVSTSLQTKEEPIPVTIKLDHRGDLPKDFVVDIKDCKIQGSAYGDISSERAIIRAEKLTCKNIEKGTFIETEIFAQINGDDGANGIRGTVVSMSDKHLKNVAIGAALSGFAGAAKGQASLDITSLGAINTKSRGMQDMAKEGAFSGASNAAEKIADQHIKLADSISPVILVPGGTKVDVIFNKSVAIGAIGEHEQIKSERVGQ